MNLGSLSLYPLDLDPKKLGLRRWSDTLRVT